MAEALRPDIKLPFSNKRKNYLESQDYSKIVRPVPLGMSIACNETNSGLESQSHGSCLEATKKHQALKS